MRSAVLLIFATLLAGCASAPRGSGEVQVDARLVSVAPGPGCGTLVIGSPTTYEVLAGPAELRGKQITALVACIEMQGMQTDMSSFTVGDMHRLILSRQNVYRIEAPSHLADASWYYLKHASPR